MNISRPMTRIAFALALSSIAAFSQSLTTIQDTLFKADGTRFTGTLTIKWNTFDASNLGTVVQQSRTVSVVNGLLQVQLAPNADAPAPANVYRVNYQSDGRNQFAETWSVRASSTPVKVSSVRMSTVSTTTGTGGGSGSGSGSGAQTPILEADVVGLLSDLDQRPLKGSGFGTGRVAVVNQNGEVDTVVGDVSDCVRVDGSSGVCGGAMPGFVDAETPGGVVDGSNDTFTLATVPGGRSLQLFRNGLYMTPGFDYTLTTNAIKFVAGNVPQPRDTVTASYRVDPATLTVGQLQTPGQFTVRGVQVLCSATGTSANSTRYTDLGYCSIPLAAIRPGDRLEVRFSVEHSGTASPFDIQMAFGATTVMQRHGSVQDSAFVGRMDASMSDSGIQLSFESYGTLLPILPGLLNAPTPAADVLVTFRAELSNPGTPDRVALRNYTVLRYPAN